MLNETPVETTPQTNAAAEYNASTLGGVLRALQSPLVQSLALIALISAAGWQELSELSTANDLDIWWHLRVGDWIVKNHSFPKTGLFTWVAGDRPWRAYSWGFELIVSRFYHWLGMIGIELIYLLLLVVISYTLFRVLRNLSNSFWAAWLLAAAGVWAIYHNLAPRPVLFSVLLFTIEIGLILRARRSGSYRPLLWLPLLMLVWANLHIQFIYGMFLLTVYVGTELAQRVASRFGIWWPRETQGSPAMPLAAIFGACIIATLIGPYSIGLYQVILEYARSTAAYSQIQEMMPLSFRTSAHFVQLLIVCSGFLALGWRRSHDVFKFAFLTIVTVVAFRATRDSWFVCIPALAFIADRSQDAVAPPKSQPRWHMAPVALGVVLVLLIGARNHHLSSATLQRAVASRFPVQAAEFVQKNRMPAPLYNNLNWGGFLIWKLPEYPVAIDGRNDLYGDAIDTQFFNSIYGAPAWTSDPYINSARTLLLDRHFPLVALVEQDRRFRTVYVDELAIVFERVR